jgi:hypothetical protein
MAAIEQAKLWAEDERLPIDLPQGLNLAKAVIAAK